MRTVNISSMAAVLLFLASPFVLAQGPGGELEALNQEARELVRAGKYELAVVKGKKALALASLKGAEDPDVASTLHKLAKLYLAKPNVTRERYEEAEPLYKRSLAIWEKSLGPEHPNVATSLNNLALLYDTQGRHDQAEPLYRRSLAITEKRLGPSHPDLAAILDNLAVSYRNTKRKDEAVKLEQRAAAIRGVSR